MSFLFFKGGLRDITRQEIEDNTNIVLTRETRDPDKLEYGAKLEGDENDCGCLEFVEADGKEVLGLAGYHSPVIRVLREIVKAFPEIYFSEGDEFFYDIVLGDEGCEMDDNNNIIKKGILNLSDEEYFLADLIYGIATECNMGIWEEEGNKTKRFYIEKYGREAFLNVYEKCKSRFSSALYSKVCEMLFRKDLDDTRII